MAADQGKVYQIKVPPNTKAGEELKLKFPGRTEKVVIKLPEGAEPGKVIQFTVPAEGSTSKGEGLGAALGDAVANGKGETDHAAILIQAKMRGKSARNLKLSKMNTTGELVADTSMAEATVTEKSSSSSGMAMFVVLIAMAAAAYYAYTEGHLDELLQTPPPPPPPAKKLFGVF